jgi:hypothetical protein
MKRKKIIASSGSKNVHTRMLSDTRRAELKASFAPTPPQPRFELKPDYATTGTATTSTAASSGCSICAISLRKRGQDMDSECLKTIFGMYKRMNSQS